MTKTVQNDRPRTGRAFVCRAGRKYLLFQRINTLLLQAIVVSILVAGPSLAQRADDILRVQTELAAFEITVTDQRGNPIKNLKAEDFRVYEEGVERQIDFFQPVRKHDPARPLSIVFAVDVSGSMTPAEIERLRFAMQRFIDRLADYNSYFSIISFAMDVRSLQPFTNRPDRLENTFQRLARDQDGLSTHAYDAVDEAVRLLVRKSPRSVRGQLPKRVVIVITDGFPVGDVVGPDTVIERANNAEVTVYAVILPSFSRFQRGKNPLPTPLEASGLIEKTGGRSLYATAEDFEPLFAALAEEVTATYAIAFYPTETDLKDRTLRRVRIESKSGFVIRQNRTFYTLK